jgi:rhamnosyltransferase subunit B
MIPSVTRRILLGWEFGGGFGHIVNLREIARHIGQNQSSEFLFALQQPRNGLAAGLPSHSVIAAPVPRRSVGGNKPQNRETYGEFVSENLMIDEGAFASCLAGWETIIRDFDPHLIIAEYAPGLSLYARGRWPVLAVGNGYTLPPPEMTNFPPIAILKHPLYATEPEIISRLNKNLKAIGAQPIERLPQLNEADAYGLATIPIFDPYKTYRQQPYLGVENPGGSPSPQETASGGIAYFHEDTQLHDKVLDGFLGASIDTMAYFGTPLRRLAKKFKGSRVSLADAPFKLRDDMAGKAVAIHKGGLGFATAAILAGVPQIMLYKHTEHWFTANAIVTAGAGLAAEYKIINAGALSEAMERVAASYVMRERALRLAEENGEFRNANPVQAIADIAAKLLRAA